MLFAQAVRHLYAVSQSEPESESGSLHIEGICLCALVHNNKHDKKIKNRRQVKSSTATVKKLK